jgi:alanyl-tRNA synthetase
LKTKPSEVAEKLEQLLQRNKQLEKELQQALAKLSAQQGADLINQTVDIHGVKVLVAQLEGVEAKALRTMLDDLKNKLGSGIILLAIASNDKVNLIAGVTKDLTAQVKAGELVNMVAQQVGGKGGGRPDMAQAGGSEPAQLPNALASVVPWLSEKLGN